MSWVRLRQVALVAADLEGVVGDLTDRLGLAVAHRDPAVAVFGLANAVLPVGCQFLEVVAPTRPGTAAGRQLERAGGDGGYMVICHTDDQEARRRAAEAAGVRVAFEADDHGFRIMQLHPGDTGGSFLEIDYQPGGDDPCGPWAPAGPDWARARRPGPATGIDSVTVSTADPDRTAHRWGLLLGAAPSGPSVEIDNATVIFVEGSREGLISVGLRVRPKMDDVVIGGVTFTASADARP